MRKVPVSDEPELSKKPVVFWLLPVLAFIAAGVASWTVANRITNVIETHNANEARSALSAEKLNWVKVTADGSIVRLSGTAPDEVARFRALTVVGSTLGDGKIDDQMKVDDRGLLDPPDFSIELIRQGNELSLIGTLPARTDRKALNNRLSKAGVIVTDLTSSVAYPAPGNWSPAIDYAASIADAIDQGTVTVMPGTVHITANVASDQDKLELEGILASAKPKGIEVTIKISAPLPIITPYRLRLAPGKEGAELEICSADSEEARNRIIDAAIKAGASGEVECMLGIGAPDGWTDAATAALGVVGEAGTLSITDDTIRITLPADAADTDLKSVADRLAQALPPAFTLSVKRSETPASAGPPKFTATVGGTTLATIDGVISDTTMRATVQSLARAQLGPLQGALKLDPGVPSGWPLRVMAGLDAIGVLDSGKLDVTQDIITINGISGDRSAAQKAILALTTRLGAGTKYSLSIAYDRRLDPEIMLPDGIECVDQLNTVMLESEIGFEPGGVRIAGDVTPAIARMRPIIQDCSAYRIEVGGHTDAQGQEKTNLQLSLGRAQAVLDAFNEAGLPVSNMTAKGYGETRPIAENDTEEGREANRRIEMTLLSPDPVPLHLPDASPVIGITPTVEDAAKAVLEASSALTLSDMPTFSPEDDVISDSPQIDSSAQVYEADTDTPRPPERPDEVLNQESAAEETQ